MNKVLRHVVMFQFKDGTPETTTREIEAVFAYLPHPAHQEFVSLVLDYWTR